MSRGEWVIQLLKLVLGALVSGTVIYYLWSIRDEVRR